MELQVKQAESEIYNYTQLSLLTACARDCSKVKVHELVKSLLKFIVLGMNFSDDVDQWITDL